MLVVQYDGTEFFGSQVQPSARTVQGTLIDVIGQILGQRPRLLFASRTDRGVHATHNVCTFKAKNIPMTLTQLTGILNDRLPRDLRVQSARDVPARFHPRYLADRRSYLYRLWRGQREDIRHLRFSAHWSGELDLASMRLAVMMMQGRHDFRAFALEQSQISDPYCDLQRLRLGRCGKSLRIELKADRFLRRMACFIVGALVDIGGGRRLLYEVGRAVNGDLSVRRFSNMPGRGLTLTEVHFPERFFSEEVAGALARDGRETESGAEGGESALNEEREL